MKLILLFIFSLNVISTLSQNIYTFDEYKSEIFKNRNLNDDSTKNQIKYYLNLKDSLNKFADTSTVSIVEKIDSSLMMLTKKLNDVQNVNVINQSDIRTILSTDESHGTLRGDFWGKLPDMKKSTLLTSSLSDLGGTLYSELLVDYLGPFRFSFSASVTASKDTIGNLDNVSHADKNAVQNFLSAGGNLILKTDLPLIYIANLNSPLTDKPGRNTRSLSLFFSNRISFGIPSLGNNLKEPSGFGDAALEMQFRILTNDRLIGIAGLIRFGGIFASKDLRVALTNNKEENGLLSYAQGSIVLLIQEKFGIYFNFPISNRKEKNYLLDKSPVSISISMVTN